MITSIISNGKYITASGGAAGVYYNNNMQPMAGMLRYYSGGRIEVYDGQSWWQVSNTASVQLTEDAIKALDWSTNKMLEEKRLEELAKTHPAIKNAYNQLKQAEEQLKITIILSQDEEQTTS